MGSGRQSLRPWVLALSLAVPGLLSLVPVPARAGVVGGALVFLSVDTRRMFAEFVFKHCQAQLLKRPGLFAPCFFKHRKETVIKHIALRLRPSRQGNAIFAVVFQSKILEPRYIFRIANTHPQSSVITLKQL